MTSAKEFKEASNTRTICALYQALSARDKETIERLLASDIEWWYHGPPAHQYMMRFLTGTVSDDNGIVTQVREYFNTSLTIARFVHNWNSNTNQSSSSRQSRTSPLINSAVWESKLSSTIGISVPGLLLAI
ncbi:hypothetical protein C5167_026720 [Papaver somniferum]|nr:hypothetical protein C5167_026720 [Papaver somniferum]